jgi:hypothetical protein
VEQNGEILPLDEFGVLGSLQPVQYFVDEEGPSRAVRSGHVDVGERSSDIASATREIPQRERGSVKI